LTVLTLTKIVSILAVAYSLYNVTCGVRMAIMGRLFLCIRAFSLLAICV